MLILKQRDSRSARGLSTSKWMVIYACLTRFSLHDGDRVTQHSRNDSIGTAVGRGAAPGVTGMFAGLYHCYGGWKDGLVVEKPAQSVFVL